MATPGEPDDLLAWRGIPAAHRSRIVPLPAAERRQWCAAVESAREALIERAHIERDETLSLATDRRRVAQWLWALGVPFGRDVVLVYAPMWVYRAPWKVVVRYHDRLFLPSSDDVAILDSCGRWLLTFDHEDILRLFALGG